MRWVRGFIGIFLCLSFLQAFLAGAKCQDALSDTLSSRKILPDYGPKRVLKNTVEVFVHPYTFPVKLLRVGLGKDPTHIWARRVDFVKDGAKALAGYLVYGLVPDLFVLSIADLHEETDEEFWNISKAELVVIVDGFENKGFLDSKRKILLQILVEERRLAGANIHYISPQNANELYRELNEIREEQGPISRLDIYSHGLEWGAFAVNEDWVSKYSNNRFFDHIRNDLMSSNAVVRFNVCLIGKSEEFLENFAKTIMPDGGVVIASKLRTINSGTAELLEYGLEKDMPAYVDQIQNILIGKAFSFGLIAYLQHGSDKAEFFTPEWNPITRVEIKAADKRH